VKRNEWISQKLKSEVCIA